MITQPPFPLLLQREVGKKSLSFQERDLGWAKRINYDPVSKLRLTIFNFLDSPNLIFDLISLNGKPLNCIIEPLRYTPSTSNIHRWTFKVQLWTFKVRLWIFEVWLWTFEVYRWTFEVQLWTFKVRLWTFKVHRWTFEVLPPTSEIPHTTSEVSAPTSNIQKIKKIKVLN